MTKRLELHCIVNPRDRVTCRASVRVRGGAFIYTLSGENQMGTAVLLSAKDARALARALLSYSKPKTKKAAKK